MSYVQDLVWCLEHLLLEILHGSQGFHAGPWHDIQGLR